MYKRTLHYRDFAGNDRTEDVYFNLTRPEAIRIELEYEEVGGFEKHIDGIAKKNSKREMVELFEMLIARSYGVKSEDGKHFHKSQEALADFIDSAAYDQLFVDILTVEENAIAFVRGVFPDLGEKTNAPPVQRG